MDPFCPIFFLQYFENFLLLGQFFSQTWPKFPNANLFWGQVANGSFWFWLKQNFGQVLWNLTPKIQKFSIYGTKKLDKTDPKSTWFTKRLTFEPLNGFSNFKRLNDLEFCQQLIKITAEVVLAKTREIGVMENQNEKLHLSQNSKRLAGPECATLKRPLLIYELYCRHADKPKGKRREK